MAIHSTAELGIIVLICLITLVMLIGVHKKRPKYVVVWVYGNIIGAAAAVLMCFSIFWSKENHRFDLLSSALMTAIYVYGVLIVYSYYRTLNNNNNNSGNSNVGSNDDSDKDYVKQTLTDELCESNYPVKEKHVLVP